MSDKVTYWAVRWQLKREHLTTAFCRWTKFFTSSVFSGILDRVGPSWTKYLNHKKQQLTTMAKFSVVILFLPSFFWTVSKCFKRWTSVLLKKEFVEHVITFITLSPKKYMFWHLRLIKLEVLECLILLPPVTWLHILRCKKFNVILPPEWTVSFLWGFLFLVHETIKQTNN